MCCCKWKPAQLSFSLCKCTPFGLKQFKLTEVTMKKFIFIGSRVGQLLLVSKYNHFILNWFFFNVCLCMKIYKSYLTSNSAFYLKMSCIQNWIYRKFIPSNSHNLCVYIHAQFWQKSDFAFFLFSSITQLIIIDYLLDIIYKTL